MGAQVAAEEPDGTGHPALRGLPAVWLRTGEAGRAGS